MPVKDRILIRRGTAAEWTTADPILAAGELGFESDTDKLKGGDGTTAWTSLPYISAGGGGGGASWGTITGTLSSQTDLQTALNGKQASGSYQATLVSGTNIKTINGATILGSGDLVVASSSNIDGGSSASVYGLSLIHI